MLFTRLSKADKKNRRGRLPTICRRFACRSEFAFRSLARATCSQTTHSLSHTRTHTHTHKNRRELYVPKRRRHLRSHQQQAQLQQHKQPALRAKHRAGTRGYQRDSRASHGGDQGCQKIELDVLTAAHRNTLRKPATNALQLTATHSWMPRRLLSYIYRDGGRKVM